MLSTSSLSAIIRGNRIVDVKRNGGGFNAGEQSNSAKLITADTSGATVERTSDEITLFLANVGISLDTLSGSVYLEVEAQHSNDGSTWAAIPDAQLRKQDGTAGTVTGTNVGTLALINDPAEDDVAIGPVGYLGDNKYVRTYMNITGTHSNGIPVASQILTMPKYPGV